MLGIPSSVRIYLACAPTDMRKGFDGLACLVEAQGLDVYSGHLFVFLNRRADKVKILTWSRGGLSLYYKRLEKGRFARPAAASSGDHVTIDAGQLAMLVDGVQLQQVRRTKAWEPPRAA